MEGIVCYPFTMNVNGLGISSKMGSAEYAERLFGKIISRNVRDRAFKLFAKELEINPLGTMRLIPTPYAPDKAT